MVNWLYSSHTILCSIGGGPQPARTTPAAFQCYGIRIRHRMHPLKPGPGEWAGGMICRGSGSEDRRHSFPIADSFGAEGATANFTIDRIGLMRVISIALHPIFVRASPDVIAAGGDTRLGVIQFVFLPGSNSHSLTGSNQTVPFSSLAVERGCVVH